jgi:hypothetical protein
VLHIHTAGGLFHPSDAAEHMYTSPHPVLPMCLLMLLHTGTAHGHRTVEAAGAHHHPAGVASRHLGVTAVARLAAAPPALHAGDHAHQTTHAAAGAAAGRLTGTGAAHHHQAVAGRRRLAGAAAAGIGVEVDG